MMPGGSVGAALDLASAACEDAFLGLSPFGFHRVAYSDWGRVENRKVLMCVHGLTRNRHDFDVLARTVSTDYRVVCPDVVGRGDSDWLSDPTGYGYPQYMSDMASLIARVGAGGIDWLGTSMGGLIGMMLAAQPNTPIHRLVLNDIGPWIPKAALERIAGYLGVRQEFQDFGEAQAYLRTIHAPFGALSDAQWQYLTHHSIESQGDAGFVLRYDPGIALAFQHEDARDIDLWDIWDRVTCPVLVLRGAESDLLTADVARDMAARGPQAKVVEFQDCGHAPALMDEGQIGVIRRWLSGD